MVKLHFPESRKGDLFVYSVVALPKLKSHESRDYFLVFLVPSPERMSYMN